MEKKDKAFKKIRITRDGPYVVSKGIPMNQAILVDDGSGASESWAEGRVYETGDKGYTLCRCGLSENKPYCDGSHKGGCFNCEETASKAPFEDRAKKYVGNGDIDLLDVEDLCAIARFCDVEPDIWDSAENSADPKSRERAVEIAWNCPAGRLAIVRKDGSPVEPDLPLEISLIEDVAIDCKGPLWVKGGIPIEGADGEVYEIRNRVTLCRCGESRNMPFCDGAHMESKRMKGLDE